MNISEEIKVMVKKAAIETNKSAKVYGITLLFLSIFCFCMAFIAVLNHEPFFLIPFGGLGLFSLFLSIKGYFNNKVSLDEDSLNAWHKSLPSYSNLVKNVDDFIKKNWEGERQIIYLDEYEVQNKNEKRIFSFVHEGKEYTFPLNKVKYDKGEKRFEYYISDRDWTVNIQKGTWFSVQIYNV